jgi:hypothetical protein
LCLLAAVVTSFGFSGCAGVAEQPHASPQVAVVPSSIAFNNVIVGQRSSQTVQISNAGHANLSIMGISLAGTGFSLSSVAVPFQLAPGANKNFTVTFTASAAASTKGTLTIVSDDPASPLSLSVLAGGQAPVAAWQVSPTSITFPSATLQSTETENASIKNTGNVSVTIGAVHLTGAGFSTSGLSTGMTLSPGQQLNFQVSFRPTVAGSTTGSLAISSSAGLSVLTVHLAASGLNAPAALQHTVTLSWYPSTGSVAGYNIYRSSVSGGPYSLLKTLDTTTTFTDASVVSGNRYFYVATAVDTKGAESRYSNEASATIPNP